MKTTAYRVHCSGESLDTVIGRSREDGWVAGDESPETQPEGVSCCASLADLARYTRHYSMAVQDADMVLELSGVVCGRDRDQYATRLDVDGYTVVCTGAELRAAIETAAALESVLESIECGEPAEDAWDWAIDRVPSDSELALARRIAEVG